MYDYYNFYNFAIYWLVLFLLINLEIREENK